MIDCKITAPTEVEFDSPFTVFTLVPIGHWIIPGGASIDCYSKPSWLRIVYMLCILGWKYESAQ